MNLNSATAASGTFTNTITVYDSLGTEIPLTLTFKRTDDATSNEWNVTGSLPDSVASATTTSPNNVTFGGTTDHLSILEFGADGKLSSPSSGYHYKPNEFDNRGWVHS